MMDWSVPLEANTAFETASGFEITLTEASLNHWVVQLTPCQASSEPLGFGLNLSTIAWAGHSVGDEALEISQVLGPMSEDLTESAAWVLSTREVDSVRYCYAYWSVASVQGCSPECLPASRPAAWQPSSFAGLQAYAAASQPCRLAAQPCRPAGQHHGKPARAVDEPAQVVLRVLGG